MKNINEKLALLQGKIENNSPIVIMIIGLGSVGLYLLDLFQQAFGRSFAPGFVCITLGKIQQCFGITEV